MTHSFQSGFSSHQSPEMAVMKVNDNHQLLYHNKTSWKEDSRTSLEEVEIDHFVMTARAKL